MNQARLHFLLLIVWCVLVVPTLLFWRDSIAWIAFMSIYAIIASHWACWEAARAKQAVEAEDEHLDPHDERRPRLEWEIDE